MGERREGWIAAALVLLALGLGAGFLLWGRGVSQGEVSGQGTAQGAAPIADSAQPVQARLDAAAAGQPVGGGSVAVAVASGIEGEVAVTGAVPVPGKLHREADPYCARTQMTDPTVLAQGGKLANVWVHVVQGAPDAPPPAGAVEMDQKDCMYTPRVTTAVVGQKILARNGDPVLHNVHAYLGPSTLFNRGMPNEKAPPLEYVPKDAGVISWKCDVHPWMRGYVGVSKNGLQAVTGADGKFRIANVPPGRYTIEAWHERYGTLSQEVTAPVRVTFTFAAR